jgi:preprotein translocase subunit YajC
MGSIIFLAIAFGAMYFILIRPQQQRTRQHEELVRTLEVGDEVLTASGLYGTIVDFEGDSDEIMRVELAPEVIVSMSRSSVVEVAIDEATDADDGADDEA